jgi:vitamin B12 transporter
MRLSLKVGIAVLSGSAAVFPAGSALAQEPIQLPGIYVQGATLEAPGPSFAAGEAAPDDGAPVADTVGGVPAYTVGNAVSVVTGEELRRQQIRHAGEALRSFPGISVAKSGGFGNFTQVRIRGAEGNHTLVLIDGIEVNNLSDGEFDFSNLSAEDLDRIEVIRGPLSSLYGSNAVGGVVNIVTRRGHGPATASARVEAGSFGTRDLAARLAGGDDRGHFAISYHGRDANGFNVAPVGQEDDGALLRTLNLRGGVRLMDGVTLDFTMRHSDKRADRDGFGNIFDTTLAGSFATAFDDASVARDRILLAGVNLKWEMLRGKLTQEFRGNHNGTTTTDADATFTSSSRNASDTSRFAYLATYRLDAPAGWGKHNLSGLVEREDERFATDFRDTSPPDDHGTHQRGRLAYAGEWRGAFADRLFLTAGVRHDDNDNFQDFTTWRTAASLLVPEWYMRPHASVGTAVKLPTMFEQFGSSQFFTPNPSLSPEKSFGWDAGIEFTFFRGYATLDVTYFQANLRDKINGFFFDPNIGSFTAINLPGESTREGVEIATRFKLSSDLTLGLAYTYLDARNPDGEREIRRPPHSGRADVNYTFAGGRGTASLAAIYNGQMGDTAFRLICFSSCPPDPLSFATGTRVSLDAYWLINAAVSYKLQPGVELFGRVENLLDRDYQEVFGFEAAPIAAFAGVKFTFGGPEGYGGSWAR